MSTNLEALETAYQAEIDNLSNAIIKAKANLLLESYLSAYEQHQSLEGGQVSSYSIGNRSFTFRDLDKSRAAVRSIEAELHRLLYGSNTLISLTG